MGGAGAGGFGDDLPKVGARTPVTHKIPAAEVVDSVARLFEA